MRKDLRKGSKEAKTAAGQSSMDFLDGYYSAAENLIKLMDECGVDRVLLMPPPQIPKQSERVANTWEVSLAVAKKHPGRILFAAGGGILNPLIHGTEPSKVTESVKADFRKKAELLVKNGVSVFGEMSVLHVAMQEKHNYSEAAADHPLFLLLADIAAESGVPIDIHMEAVEEPVAPPSSLAKVSHNPRMLPATIPGFEKLLRHNRKARIVWQHIGWDNTGGMTPALVGRLLADHPNLYLALRVENTKGKSRAFKPNRLVDADGRIDSEWKKLIIANGDRVVIGADEFVSAPGARRMPQSFKLSWGLLKQLPRDLQGKIGRDNVLRIYAVK